MIQPTPITRADKAKLVALEGAQLESVTYHYLPPADAPSYAGGGEGVDSDLAAIELRFTNRELVVITWAMTGELEGLAVLGASYNYAGLVAELAEVTDTAPWRPYRGATVNSVGAAWHVSGHDCPEALWSLRLDCSNESVVIALGTADPGIRYMPDELIVLFDRSLASSYRPLGVDDSSWGQVVERP